MISTLLKAWAATVAIETAVLVPGLSREHPLSARLVAGVFLSSVTLPVVWMAFPVLINPHTDRALYLAVAETFAALAECALFAMVHRDRTSCRDLAAIVLANLASFLIGEAYWRFPR